ncbi:MAG: hypothetical protein GEU95_04435 [Rhizobiales bacterium]|nr:hypothetical protein [Hyphomicrobiales bacterium]
MSGGAIVSSIAAASIVAKVTRNRLMTRLALAHPRYGFERHIGYSVPGRQEALARLGPTIHHRPFSPVTARNLLESDDPDEIIPAVLPL